MKKVIFINIILLTYIYVMAEPTLSGDKKYMIKKSDTIEYIYPYEYSNVIDNNTKFTSSLLLNYEKSYEYRFDSRLGLALISDNRQVANAYASILPFNQNIFYSGGSDSIDYFGYISWYRVLAIHEIAHSYQLNAKNEFSKKLSIISANTPIIFLPNIMFAYIIYPSILLPSFILEGNSVMNESIFDNGGRLYSYQVRSIFNALIKAKVINQTKLINNDLSFPYGREPYIVGGYFFKYLAYKFGVKKSNSFFVTNTNRFINPLRLNQSFYEHFGRDFDDLFEEFISTMQIGNNQKWLQGKIIASSQSFKSLNGDKDEIYFLTSDFKSTPFLYIVNKSSNTIKMINKNLPLSKVFKLDNRYFTLCNTFTNTDRFEYGLCDESQNIFRGTESKIVQDIASKDRLIYFDVDRSFEEPFLMVGEEEFGYINSSVLVDDSENIYYFKQDKKSRVLYKNYTKLYSFKGYSSKIVDVVGNKIYFVANSKYGSTLFVYDNKIVYRVSSADNILDFKYTNNNGGIFVSVEGDGYKIIDTKLDIMQVATPYMVDLHIKPIELIESKTQEPLQNKEYVPMKEIRYSKLNFSHYIDDKSIKQTNFGLVFSDLLSQNSINLDYSSYGEYKTYIINYQNREYLLNYDISYMVNTFKTQKLEYMMNKLYYNYFYARDTLSFNLVNYINRDIFINEYSSYYTNSYKYKYSYDYNYLNRIGVSYINASNYDTLAYLYNFTYGLSNEIFIKFNLNGAMSDKSMIYIGELAKSSIELDSNIYINSKNQYTANSAISFETEISKVFNFSLYSFTLPISLRREAIKFGMQSVLFNIHKIDEYYSSLEFELLLFHELASIGFIKVYKNSEKDAIAGSFGIDMSF